MNEKRFGDIKPVDDVVLVLGEKEFKLKPPNNETVAKIEQWHTARTNEKKNFLEIIQNLGLDMQAMTELLCIVIQASNDPAPSLEWLSKHVNTMNWIECGKALMQAAFNAQPEPEEPSAEQIEKTVFSDNQEIDFKKILRVALERGIRYEEFWKMTLREVFAVISEESENKTPVSPNYDPNWIKKSMENAKEKGTEQNPGKILLGIFGKAS